MQEIKDKMKDVKYTIINICTVGNYGIGKSCIV